MGLAVPSLPGIAVNLPAVEKSGSPHDPVPQPLLPGPSGSASSKPEISLKQAVTRY